MELTLFDKLFDQPKKYLSSLKQGNLFFKAEELINRNKTQLKASIICEIGIDTEAKYVQKEKVLIKKNVGLNDLDLTHAEVNSTYIIKKITTEDKAMRDFLFTLGCYDGEKITVISVIGENYIINIKNARYSIDIELAKAINI